MAIVRSVFRYDPSEWRPLGAVLRGLGVAMAAVGGSRFGGDGAAVLAAIGALYAGIASFGGVHPARLRRMLAAILAASVTTLLGCIVQPSTLATVVVVTFGTFVLAIVADAGPDAAQVSLLATGLLVVFSGLRGAHDQPLGNALLVLGGGSLQAVLLMVVHPFSPVAAEQRGVSAVYAGMARFARAKAAGRGDEPLPDVATPARARELLQDGMRYGDRPELRRLWRELELADALRGNLAGLSRNRGCEATWVALAAWFEEGADAILRGRPLDRRLAEFDCDLEAAPWLRRIRATAEAEAEGRMPILTPSPRALLLDLLHTERLRSVALGHALRYALAIGIATATYRLLEFDHGYWAPLSLAFSLKPDFRGTFTKGVGRIVGTVAGVALSTLLVAQFHPSASALAVVLLGATWAAFALINAWYVGYSAALAFWVVVAVTLAGASATTVGLERIEATAAGSLFALFTAIVWPRWESGKTRMALAVSFAAQAEYADAVLAHEGEEALARARLQSRAARLEAERVVGAAAFEPHWGRGRHLDGADVALARLAENAARILAAHVAVLDPHGGEPPDDLRLLAEGNRLAAADLMG